MKFSDVKVGMVLRHIVDMQNSHIIVVSVSSPLSSPRFAYQKMDTLSPASPMISYYDAMTKESDIPFEIVPPGFKSIFSSAVPAAPPPVNTGGAIIAARQSTHGVFKENTVYMQSSKDLMRAQPNWNKMSAYQLEALDMFQHKIGRILHGDPNFCDHWDDISGYAERVSKTIKGDMSP